MKVKLPDNRILKIWFRYTKAHIENLPVWCIGKRFNNPHDTWQVTTCYVADVTKLDSPIIGRAVCSMNDRFEKVIGRKHALVRAIHYFPREHRTKIWTEIHAKTGHGSKKSKNLKT